MDIVQTFYDNLAARYDNLFADWESATHEQARLLSRLFAALGHDASARVLDCACGIGTQTIGLAAQGYAVTASDISEAELCEARRRAEEAGLSIPFFRADFRALEESFDECFDIVICMDNALPHMLTEEELKKALQSIALRVGEGGVFIASIRDYDALLCSKPPYSPPYIHDTGNGRRICFQTWDWSGDSYRLTQYIIDDGAELSVSRYDCQYRAVRRQALSELLQAAGFSSVRWHFPEETGFYQPIVSASR